MSRREAVLCLTLVVPAAVMLAGCGDAGPVSKDNYDKVFHGMTLDEVEALLGRGRQEVDFAMAPGGRTMMIEGVGAVEVGAKVYSWRDDGKVIRVVFERGRVIAKSQTGL